MLSGSIVKPHGGGSPKKLVILLHGYGASGDNLLDLAHFWSPLLPEAEFVAPNAPDICEINPFGYQWFGLKDITAFSVRAGLDNIRPTLTSYIIQQLSMRHLTPQDLVLVGFSQGTMLALEMMFAITDLRGVIGYSGAFYPPIATLLPAPTPEVLLVHGDLDTVVPYAAFTEAVKNLKKFGVQPQTLTCPGLAHSIDEEGLEVGGQFLTYLFNINSSIISAHSN